MGRALPRRLTLPMLALALVCVAEPARADRVVLTRVRGFSSPERLGDIERSLEEATYATGHEPLSERGAWDRENDPPSTAAELKEISEIQGATYVLVPSVEVQEHGYRLRITFGHSPVTSVERASVWVPFGDGEQPRLRRLLAVTLKPEPLSDADRREILSMSQPDEVDVGGNQENESSRRKRAQGVLAAMRGKGKEVPKSPPRYWATLAANARPVFASESSPPVLFGPGVRAGYEMSERLGIRGGADVHFGAVDGISLRAGATLWFTRFDLFSREIRFGYLAELGIFQGNASFFLMAGAPVFETTIAGAFFAQLAPLELGFISAADGLLTLGLSLHGGMRF